MSPSHLRPFLWASAGAFLTLANVSNAQFQSYFENFDVDNSANWVATPASGGVHAADFFFDYSTVGIPPAPNSAGGTTRGLKLTANMDAASQVLSGISASPVGLNLQGDYEVHFDMWCNFNGPAPAGGSGSTQVTGAGIGSTSTKANFVGSADAIWMAVSVDGNSTADYRVYDPAHQSSYQDASGVYAVPSRNNTHTYWATNFPGQTAPAAQVALFPQQTGTTLDGAQAFKWRNVVIRKAGNGVTFKIDGVLMATIDYAASGATGGNLVFVQSDINAGASTDPNAASLLFGLIDNIRVTNLASIVTASVTVPTGNEFGPSAAVFTLTRNEPSLAQPRTINIALTGTASNGVDYASVPATVTIPAGLSSVDVTINPVDDSVSEFEESVVLTILPGAGYSLGAPSTVSATILDNDPAVFGVEPYMPTVYERVAQDYAAFRLVRKGDVYAGPFSVDITYSGTAAAGRFSGPASVYVNPGDVYTAFQVSPVNDSILQGDQTIVATITAGAGYGVDAAKASASATIVDDELPAETVLYAENFNTDVSANWITRFGSGNGIEDYTINWAYDYAGNLGLPPAPNGRDSIGVYMTVNKNDPTAIGAAGLNLYPKSKTFSGDYALRFDMYMLVNSTATTEYALVGINHSGNLTNWMRLSGNGFTNSVYDGIFTSIEADASGSEDYMMLSSPVSNYAGVWMPRKLAVNHATALTNVLKSPPWFAGSIAGGSPANSQASDTPTWADVELSQVGGVITLKINRSEIMRVTNNTPHTSGNIMVGYTDSYDSSTGTGGAVIIDNLRVVGLTAPQVKVTGIQKAGNNVELTFTYTTDQAVSTFKVQSSASAGTGYADDASAAITRLSAGTYKAVLPMNGAARFYRVRTN